MIFYHDRPLQEIDFDDIARCRDAVIQECPHPRTCAFRDPVAHAGNPIDLIGFAKIRRDFDALCTPGKYSRLQRYHSYLEIENNIETLNKIYEYHII